MRRQSVLFLTHYSLQDVDLFAMHKVIDDELTGWRNVAVDRCERVPCSGK